MNTYYYISKEGKQEGPVTTEELLKKGITRETLVWRESMPQWAPASEVEELSKQLGSTPPPVSPNSQTPPPTPPRNTTPPQRENNTASSTAQVAPPPERKNPSNYLTYSILATLLCCLAAGIPSIVYASKANSAWNAGQYEEAEEATKNARLWLFISIGLGVVGYILCGIFGFFSAVFG